MKRANEAFRSEGLTEQGMGVVVVARYKADGRCEAGFFLLDLCCLGVKDAGYGQFVDEEDMRRSLGMGFSPLGEFLPMKPSCARKLIEGAVEYARNLGFAPHRDYKKACRVLGGISSADCAEAFEYGKGGKPFFMPGPDDSPEKVGRILLRLEKACGPDGFEYVEIVEGMDDEGDGAEADDGFHEAMSGYAERIGAEHGVLAGQTPPGRPRVSEQLLDVAMAFFREEDSYEEKKALVHMAGLAWNFSCMPEKEQEKVRGKIQSAFRADGVQEVFDDMVLLVREIAPGDRPTIMDVETDRDDDGELVVRVASTRDL